MSDKKIIKIKAETKIICNFCKHCNICRIDIVTMCKYLYKCRIWDF